MTAAREALDYLHDMLDHIAKAQRFAQSVAWDEFHLNEEKVFAVIHALEIIGEAARHIPPDLRERYSQIPWRSITGMRDKMAHNYSGVDIEVVWKTVQYDLPLLQTALLRMISELENE